MLKGDKPEIVIWWLRRDIRIHDNQTLYRAICSGYPVLPVFIFDDEILTDLNPDDRRVEFIVRSLINLQNTLYEYGRALRIIQGIPLEVFKGLNQEFNIRQVFAGVDYEPYSISRDRIVEEFLHTTGGELIRVEDHVILSPALVTKIDGTPYSIFTPFKKRWLEVLSTHEIHQYASDSAFGALMKDERQVSRFQGVKGFRRVDFDFPLPVFNEELIKNYHLTRDLPSVEGTSRLGIHLRFGTISIRKLCKRAIEFNSVYLNELIWRDFYQMILLFHPHVVNRCFKPAYENIQWKNCEEDIMAWSTGKTGYPLVDAGMRQLIATGYMHNRVRMLAASFLTKHLLVDWRFGEALFSRHLLDYELASNNGGWQWAAGTGSDAAPYFRVFNPVLQARLYDPQACYIKTWLPEYKEGKGYPLPIVDHKYARARALRVYGEALQH